MIRIFLTILLCHEICSVCQFPEDWIGSWFLSGHRSRFNITENRFGSYGSCIKSQAGTFIVQHEIEQCPRCIQVNHPHPNVLEFQAGGCIFYPLEQVNQCLTSTENNIHMLVKIDGPDTECPLAGPLDFSYHIKGGRECKSPQSEVAQCLQESQLMFSFQSCPDDYITISKDEILTCKAVWVTDTGQTFLLATWDHRNRIRDEERLRCFLMKNTTNGYLLSQSSSPSCQGLSPTSSGFIEYNLTTPTYTSECSFPLWLVQPRKYFTLDHKLVFTFSPNNPQMEIRNYSAFDKRETLLSKNFCVEIVEQTDNSVKIISRTVTNCESLYKCTVFTKRSQNIVEVEEGVETLVRLAACAQTNFNPDSSLTASSSSYSYHKPNRIITLVKDNPSSEPCPQLGLHNLSSLYIAGNSNMCNQFWFHRLAFACNRMNEIQFYRECQDNPATSSYYCVGAWTQTTRIKRKKEDQKLLDSLTSRERIHDHENLTFGFIIAQPDYELEGKTLPRRACFVYTQIGENMFTWSAGKSECLHNIIPGIQGSYRFNTTKIKSCSPTVSTSAGARMPRVYFQFPPKLCMCLYSALPLIVMLNLIQCLNANTNMYYVY